MGGDVGVSFIQQTNASGEKRPKKNLEQHFLCTEETFIHPLASAPSTPLPPSFKCELTY
jgi:hypothetical protein